MAADPGNYPGVGSPGQGVRWEGRLTEKKERTDEFNHKKGKHQEHFRCLNCWLVSTKTDLSRVPFLGKKGNSTFSVSGGFLVCDHWARLDLF